MSGQPRVGHAGEVAGHQDHLIPRVGQQRGKLAQALARPAHHRDRRHRRAEQPGRGRPQPVQNRCLGLVRQAEVAVLGHLGREPDTRFHRGAGYQPQRGLVQITAIGKSRILPGINQRLHHHPSAAAGSPPTPVLAAEELPGPYVVQAQSRAPGRPSGGRLDSRPGRGGRGSPGTFASMWCARSRM